MLLDGNRLGIVDWETAFQNDRYADLAVVANMIVTNESEERMYLQKYFGAPPEEHQSAREPLDRSEAVPDYSDFQRRFWGREVGRADTQAKSIFGRVH